jgi:hypothetical protein
MSTRTQSAIMREVGTSAAGTERVDAGKWVPSTHGASVLKMPRAASRCESPSGPSSPVPTELSSPGWVKATVAASQRFEPDGELVL